MGNSRWIFSAGCESKPTMNANELYNFSISPLVPSNFALEWSEDNHVSIVTQRGVHVFEFIPHPMCIYPTLKFWRTFVHPSDFVPAEPFASQVDSAIWKMDRGDIYSLLMEHAVTPKIEDKIDLAPRIVKLAWSPAKLAESSKSLLAIVTSAGSIEILYKFGNDWLSIFNLASQWSRLVAEESGLDPGDLGEESFDKISWPEHIRRLLGTAVAWSPLLVRADQSPFAYFVAAYRSADIVVSRIERVSDLAGCSGEPRIVYRTKLEASAKIGQVLWLNLENGRHVIFVCYADGKIHGLCLVESNGILREGELRKYYDHADRMATSSIRRIKKTGNGNFVVVATKSSCIVALSVDGTGECTQTRCLRVAGFSITGLTVISGDKVIATTQNCRVYAVTIPDAEELTSEPIKNDLKCTKVQYLGLASSPNSTILLNVTSPDATHDHLMNREPSTVQVFALSGDEWDPRRIIEQKRIANSSLHTYWDCLESMRIRASKCPTELEKLSYEVPKNLDGLSIDGLRLVMWLTLISEVLDKKQILKGVDKIVGEISEAQPLIFLLSACEHLSRLSRKSSVNDEERRCMSFLRMYMEIYMAGENEEELMSSELSRRVAEALAASSRVDCIETESCDLCGEVITELPWTVDSCTAGHKLPRCSTTLLQVTSIRYRVCPVCERIFHPSLDDEYGETRCLYCDVPAQHDPRILSGSLGDLRERWKNLSRRPTACQTEARAQDGEQHGATEKPFKRRGMNPHTFAVIVNKDDDDSFITETWQEF